MIRIENVDVFGWEAAIRGMRNPMNSHDKSDSGLKIMNEEDAEFGYEPNYEYVVGENDLTLMKKLCKAGTDHRKFMRMINVTMDITAPLYWWKEYDTYKIGTVANSASTMLKIHAKEFTLDDFSHEHMNEKSEYMLKDLIKYLNAVREAFLETKDKTYWWQMIQLLPSSYNQRRTVQLNYEVLCNMYHARRNHKLDEWVEFCKWIETLPNFKELVLGD